MSNAFNFRINELTAEMVELYQQDESFISYASAAMPNRKAVIALINDIRELFYPRHFADRELYQSTVEYYVGNLMQRIEESLNHQVRLAFNRRMHETGDTPEMIEERASEISCAFMNRLPEARTLLTMDVQAAYDGDPAAADIDQIIISYPGVFAMMVYRVAHILVELGVPLIPRIMTEYAHTRTGIDINPGAKIGKFFFMDHGTGIVIGETTEIGDNVKVYQGVTLGALSTRGGQSLRGRKRHPTIEDNVTIYSNCSILGGETIIGHDSIIGGNAFITRSIPPCSKISIKNPELQVEGKAPEEMKDDFKWAEK